MARIDQRRLDELRGDVGDEVFDDVLAMSLEEMEEVLNAMDAPDAEALHFLKGAALNIGLSDFGRICRDAEAAVKDGRPPPNRAELRACYDESRSEVLQQGASRMA